MILKYSRMLIIVGGTLTVAGAFSQLMNVNVASYIFTTGAAMLIVYQFMAYMTDKKKDLRTQRLSRLNFIYSLLLGLAAYFMFVQSNSWVVVVLIYALVSLFNSFRTK